MTQSGMDAETRTPAQKPPLSSSLDRIETTIQTTTIVNNYQEYLYAADPDEYRQSLAVLHHLYQFSHPETPSRLEHCGADAAFFYDQDTGRVVVRASHCHIRWCPTCAASRASRLSGLTFDWLSSALEPSFITLTLQHHPGEALAAQLGRLHEAFKKFRRNSEIKKYLHGGIWFLQLKRGRDAEWHSHLHIAADSTYIPVRAVSDIWLSVTGDSKIVDIQRIRDPKKMAAYVARYVAKPCRLSDFSFADAVEIVTATKGRRLYGKFGTAKDLDFSPSPADDAPNLVRLGKFSTLLRLARLNPSSAAADVIIYWKSGEPLPWTQAQAAADWALYAEADFDDTA